MLCLEIDEHINFFSRDPFIDVCEHAETGEKLRGPITVPQAKQLNYDYYLESIKQSILKNLLPNPNAGFQIVYPSDSVDVFIDFVDQLEKDVLQYSSQPTEGLKDQLISKRDDPEFSCFPEHVAYFFNVLFLKYKLIDFVRAVPDECSLGVPSFMEPSGNSFKESCLLI